MNQLRETFKVVLRDGRNPWIAALGEQGRVFCYLHLSGRFHFNEGLHHDYYIDQESTFGLIDKTEAVRLINAGVGKHSDHNEWVARDIMNSKWSMSAEEVLGEAAAEIIND